MDIPMSEHKFSANDRWQDPGIRYCTENGIFLASLSHKAGSVKDYKLCFTLHNPDRDRRIVKELITSYLQSAFDAINLRFYLKDSQNGYVHFDIDKSAWFGNRT